MDSSLICLSEIALNLSQLTQFLCELHPNKAKPSQDKTIQAKTRLGKNIDNAAPCEDDTSLRIFRELANK